MYCIYVPRLPEDKTVPYLIYFRISIFCVSRVYLHIIKFKYGAIIRTLSATVFHFSISLHCAVNFSFTFALKSEF